jgi:hypothetical protein
MKRFLLVLALVAVVGATYIAAAPGSQAAGPTAAQFNALKRQVAGLKRQVKAVKALALAEAVLLTDCMASSAPITRRGDWETPTGPTFGYSYSDPSINSGTPFPETALDVTDSSDPTAMWITGGGSKCGADVGTARRNIGRLAGLRVDRVTPLFSTHRH